MKFTSFNPLIVTKDAAPVIALFEALGFDRRHTNTNIDDKDITNVTMKDANGFHVDVAQADVPRDLTLIRMNVDDFDEAYAFLMDRGFTHPSGRVWLGLLFDTNATLQGEGVAFLVKGVAFCIAGVAFFLGVMQSARSVFHWEEVL